MSKHDQMYERIKKHGEELNVIFDTGLDPVVLCKKLRRLELKAHSLAVHYCNGTGGINSDNWEEKCVPILRSVRKILKIKNNYPLSPDDLRPIFLNGDARGYALKVYETYVNEHNLKIYRDWGGFGILAPDLTKN